ncbi:hypothetical protein [Hyalangium versicolor]|uniref:hypothetical protein n=1 Tax=Hyalangium versicolor TaxID=2861190 RepID=UPI001CCF28DF|nr:hypothetical protein [Hyalangium versicolor]
MHWRGVLQVAEENAGEELLQICYGVKPAGLEILKDSVRCSFDLMPGATKKPRFDEFGAIISASGFGTERVRTHNSRDAFASVHFWQNDRLESLSGLSAPSVVIAGSGDGALQDFIRVASGMRSALELMTYCMPAEPPGSFRERIQAAEDQAVRAASWASTSEHDHAIQLRLHESYMEAIQDLFSKPPFNSVPERINQLLKGRPFSKLTLVHPCRHFSQSYALNRVLVCMVQEALSRGIQRGRVEVLGETGVAEVQCVGCKAPPEANLCFGRRHRVQLNPRTCSGTKAVDRTIEAEVVVLRLGIDRGAKATLGERPGGGLRRQLLPYFPTR